MKLHHIGIITDNIQSDAAAYEFVGYQKFGEPVIDDIQKNELLFMRNACSGETIELIEPIDRKSTVASAKKGIAHLCYEVNDLEATLSRIKREHLGVIFTEILLAPALGNGRIAFVYYKGGVVLELFEPKKTDWHYAYDEPNVSGESKESL